MTLTPLRLCWLLIPLLGACTTSTSTTAPRQPSTSTTTTTTAFDLTTALGLPILASDAPLAIELGPPSPYDGYAVHPLSFEPWPGFRSSAALWLPDGEGPFPGVLVLPGHFGEGKASGECQEIAHALAARGVVALALDMPGVEEWDRPERQLHFDGGAHNRAALVAAGTSALGMQTQLARRGLDALLEAAPVDRVAATGASGGGVLAFYLALVEPRVRAIVLASPVGIPRDDHSGGCFCDVLPGSPGPSADLLASLEQPSLWLSELEAPPPAGLPTDARWESVPGPHSYTAAMRAIALPWLDTQLGHSPPEPGGAQVVIERPPHTPGAALRSPTVRGAMSILELALTIGAPGAWTPQPELGMPSATATCSGEGRPVITAGVEPHDRAALSAAGWQACDLLLPPDQTWEPRALTHGYALADRPAAALLAVSSSLGDAPIYAVGPWAIPAAASGVPWVGRAPLHSAQELDPATHPAWVHVPGGWWGGLETLYASALALGDEPEPLIEALPAAE
jgi:dienelactone hydrolase